MNWRDERKEQLRKMLEEREPCDMCAEGEANRAESDARVEGLTAGGWFEGKPYVVNAALQLGTMRDGLRALLNGGDDRYLITCLLQDLDAVERSLRAALT